MRHVLIDYHAALGIMSTDQASQLASGQPLRAYPAGLMPLRA